MSVRRTGAARLWWLCLWFSLALLLATQALDAWRRSAPPLVWLLWLGPLLLFVPGVLRDRLRSVTWLCFLSLMYFVVAVQRSFAEPGDPRAVIELLAVIALFTSTMLYIRFRGRSLRLAQAPTPAPGQTEAQTQAQAQAQAQAQTASASTDRPETAADNSVNSSGEARPQ